MSKRFISVPELELATDLSSTAYTLKTKNKHGWDGDFIAAQFNTDYIPATLINDAGTLVEFIAIDATTIANIDTTGATIYKRGLKTYAEGVAADYDEVTANKLAWTNGQTKVLIGTNPPLLYASFANRYNDDEILADWDFSGRAPTIPTEISSEIHRAASIEYVNNVAIAGAPDASTTVKGIGKLSTAPASPTDPIAVGTNDPRVPTQSENDALAGRSGTPSASQPYETVHDSSNAATITASTISFTASTKTISDSGSGFVTANFIAGTQVTVTGSVSNNSTFTIVSVLAGAIVVAESLVDEVAGASVTMTTITANKLVRYTSTSQVKVPTTPVASNDAVSKSYTDTSVATLTTGQTSLLNHSVHAIETSNTWFTYPIALLATSSTAVAGWDTSNANMSGGGAGLTQWGISPAAGYIRASVQGHTSGNTYTAASNKDIKIKFRHKFEGAIGAGIYAGIGITNGTISTIQTDTASNSIRFVLNNATLYAVNSDGANYTATDISGLMTYTNWNIYEIVFNPGVNIVYYINGTAVATHTTNLPTGNLHLFALGASNGVTTIGRISPIVISMEM